ncbi:MAG: UDP-N-acetylmuramoyl-L-alanine--D-glutamate ligase [Planctomycetes bacterium]|nr:UDP-N-acetylmuramoyl-L-alanine--D-glutamate ligase [Planctomycetota bacterium]
MSGPARRALVLGLGRFGGGQEAAAFLLRRGWRVRIADRAPAETLREAAAALAEHEAIEWQLGREDEELLAGVDLLVVNPAVGLQHPLVLAATRMGIPISQEVNLFLEHYPGRVVLVTGTKGKSTTATLLARALERSGHDTLLGGNIGRSLLGAERDWRGGQIAVLEVSSFQLTRVDPSRHAVAGAVLVRIGRDHLDWHGSLHAYHAAKGMAAALARDFLVHGADDPVAAGFASAATRRSTFARGGRDGAECVCVDGWVHARLRGASGPVLHLDALRLLGAFHQENVMAAFLAAAALGADRHLSALALVAQEPLPFRLQHALTVRGVRIYDNAVSTELDSTVSALESLQGPVRWVGGGKTKDGDFGRVADAVAPRAASAHLFGAAAQPLGELLGGRLPVTVHTTLRAALAAALETARPGDALLFSPAFASFDQYLNFRARAEDFRGWLRALVSPASDPARSTAPGQESDPA